MQSIAPQWVVYKWQQPKVPILSAAEGIFFGPGSLLFRRGLSRVVRAVSDIHSQLADLMSPSCVRAARGVLRRVGIRADDYPDVLQESYLAAWKSLRAGHYRPGRGPVVAWFTGIVKHRAIDWLRHAAVRSESAAPSTGLEAVCDLPPSDFCLEVQSAIERLPLSMRDVVRLHIEGLTTAEIAKQLDRSCGRTGALLADGHRRLKMSLQGSGEVAVQWSSSRRALVLHPRHSR